MAQIDIGKMAFAGFSLIGRKPLALVGWALFILVLGILPAVGIFAAMGPALADLIAQAQSGGDPTPEQMMPLMSGWYAANPILTVLSLVTRIVLTGAVFRAVLEPKSGGWAYLRLGMGEVMLALVVICLSIILIMVSMVWIGVTVGVCFAIWQASHAAAIGVGILSGVALAVTMIWLSLRFCVAAPMSFAERNFRLFESWSVTRGNALNLLLAAIVIFLELVALEMIVVALFAAVVMIAGGVTGLGGPHHFDEAAIEAFFRQSPSTWLTVLGPWIAAIAVVGSLIAAVFMAVVTAPWAEAYRQLRATPDAAP